MKLLEIFQSFNFRTDTPEQVAQKCALIAAHPEFKAQDIPQGIHYLYTNALTDALVKDNIEGFVCLCGLDTPYLKAHFLYHWDVVAALKKNPNPVAIAAFIDMMPQCSAEMRQKFAESAISNKFNTLVKSFMVSVPGLDHRALLDKAVSHINQTVAQWIMRQHPETVLAVDVYAAGSLADRRWRKWLEEHQVWEAQQQRKRLTATVPAAGVAVGRKM